jgi:hypothetical protein
VLLAGDNERECDDGGGGCNERCNLFVNARQVEKVWKIRALLS